MQLASKLPFLSAFYLLFSHPVYDNGRSQLSCSVESSFAELSPWFSRG